MWQIYKQNRKLFLSLCVTSFGEEWQIESGERKKLTPEQALQELQKSLNLPVEIGVKNGSPYGKL
jgi:hypothetical protein